MTEGDVALACMRAFAGALVRSGVAEVCLSPGSRSTPLALAVARERGLRVHVHLDERASAFFALGAAKATGRSVAVVTTSGTAAANLFPAVVEASMARVPLLLLTADRPPELRGVGANQTIDQLELYGRYVRWFVDAEVPTSSPGARSAWEELARRAVARSLGPPPGPVHLNLPFREPLVPSGAEVTLEGDPLDATREDDPVPGPRAPSGAQMDALLEALSLERGAIVAGALRSACRPALDLAERRGWPLLGEPTSRLRVPGALAAGSLLLADPTFSKAYMPQVVVQLGAAPMSRAGLAFVARAEKVVIVDPDGLVADPGGHADLRIEADPASLLRAILPDLPPAASTSSWLEGWRRADDLARRAVDGLLDSWEEPYEGRIARDLAAGLRDGSTLVVGSSMPVRDLDAYMAPRDGVRMFANRGASGIDGFVSTVLGVSVAGRPTFALCGDLTLLHDAGSLLWSARRGYHAVFVVPNNDGGGIFALLAQRELPELETLFVTPHGLDLQRLAGAAGAVYERVDRAVDLVPAVERAAATGGVAIVEVPVDRDRNVTRHDEVAAAVASALERT